jgi:hypothetical protein
MKFITLVTALSLNYYLVSASTCAWTPTCWGTAYGNVWACQKDFPFGGSGSGKERSCSGVLGGKQFECCGVTKIVTDECEWSYCAGALVGGQTTCNDVGKDLYYTGRYTGSGCGFSTNQKVQCCKTKNV